jgi:hypothetical protein
MAIIPAPKEAQVGGSGFGSWFQAKNARPYLKNH